MTPMPSRDRPRTVAGVDGCPGGWVVAHHDAGTLRLERVDGLDALVGAARQGEVDLVAIDMPIGLLETERRAGDAELRRRLGPRRASLFPPPIRSVLAAADYDEARRVSRAACGRAPSIQAWNLVPKIVEVDTLLMPADQQRVVEAHPELAFARLGPGPCPEAKSTAEGRADRLERCRARFGHDVVEAALIDRPAPLVDCLDAIALCDVAHRILDGDAEAIGWQCDARGMRATVWV